MRQPNFMYSGDTRNPWAVAASSLGQALFGDPGEQRAREAQAYENEYRHAATAKLQQEIDAAAQLQEQNNSLGSAFTDFMSGGGGGSPAVAGAAPAMPAAPVAAAPASSLGGPFQPPPGAAAPVAPVTQAALPPLPVAPQAAFVDTEGRGSPGMPPPGQPYGDAFAPPAAPAMAADDGVIPPSGRNFRYNPQPTEAPPSPLGAPFSDAGYAAANPQTVPTDATAQAGPVPPQMRGAAAPVTPTAAPFDMDRYLQYLAQRESSGGTNNKNTMSSAAGRYGFTDGTWQDQGGTGSALGASDAETDQRIRSLTMENYASLKRVLGRDPSFSELYAAHHFGATGGARLINAGIDTPMEQAISSQALDANPYVKGQSVGDWFMKANADFPQQWNGDLPATATPEAPTMEAGAPQPDPTMEAGAPPPAADPAAQALQAAFVPPQGDGLDIQTAAVGGPDLPISTPTQGGGPGDALSGPDETPLGAIFDAGGPQAPQIETAAGPQMPDPAAVAAPAGMPPAAPSSQPRTIQEFFKSLTPSEVNLIQVAPNKGDAIREILGKRAEMERKASGGGGLFGGTGLPAQSLNIMHDYQAKVLRGEMPTMQEKMDYEYAKAAYQTHTVLKETAQGLVGVAPTIPNPQGFVDPYDNPAGAGAAPGAGGAPAAGGAPGQATVAGGVQMTPTGMQPKPTDDQRSAQSLYKAASMALPTAITNYDAISGLGNWATLLPADKQRMLNGLQTAGYQQGKAAITMIGRMFSYAQSGKSVPETEMQANVDAVMPVPGDEPDTLKFKKQMLQFYVDSIAAKGYPYGLPTTPGGATPPAGPTPDAGLTPDAGAAPLNADDLQQTATMPDGRAISTQDGGETWTYDDDGSEVTQ